MAEQKYYYDARGNRYKVAQDSVGNEFYYTEEPDGTMVYEGSVPKNRSKKSGIGDDGEDDVKNTDPTNHVSVQPDQEGEESSGASSEERRRQLQALEDQRNDMYMSSQDAMEQSNRQIEYQQKILSQIHSNDNEPVTFKLNGKEFIDLDATTLKFNRNSTFKSLYSPISIKEGIAVKKSQYEYIPPEEGYELDREPNSLNEEQRQQARTMESRLKQANEWLQWKLDLLRMTPVKDANMSNEERWEHISKEIRKLKDQEGKLFLDPDVLLKYLERTNQSVRDVTINFPKWLKKTWPEYWARYKKDGYRTGGMLEKEQWKKRIAEARDEDTKAKLEQLYLQMEKEGHFDSADKVDLFYGIALLTSITAIAALAEAFARKAINIKQLPKSQFGFVRYERVRDSVSGKLQSRLTVDMKRASEFLAGGLSDLFRSKEEAKKRKAQQEKEAAEWPEKPTPIFLRKRKMTRKEYLNARAKYFANKKGEWYEEALKQVQFTGNIAFDFDDEFNFSNIKLDLGVAHQFKMFGGEFTPSYNLNMGATPGADQTFTDLTTFKNWPKFVYDTYQLNKTPEAEEPELDENGNPVEKEETPKEKPADKDTTHTVGVSYRHKLTSDLKLSEALSMSHTGKETFDEKEMHYKKTTAHGPKSASVGIKVDNHPWTGKEAKPGSWLFHTQLRGNINIDGKRMDNLVMDASIKKGNISLSAQTTVDTANKTMDKWRINQVSGSISNEDKNNPHFKVNYAWSKNPDQEVHEGGLSFKITGNRFYVEPFVSLKNVNGSAESFKFGAFGGYKASERTSLEAYGEWERNLKENINNPSAYFKASYQLYQLPKKR